jgi:small nuclear ribonucleoprotein (snRNP)-like protein
VSSLSAAIKARADAAIPTAFASASHDEFNQRRKPGGSNAGARGGGAAAGSRAATVTAAATTIYRSPLSSRPLVRTLVAVLQALVGRVVRVELRNESWTRGTLEEVGPQGNLRLSNATTHRPAGYMPPPSSSSSSPPATTVLEHMFIPGRSVRYVVLPDRVDAAAALTAHEGRLDAALLEYRRRKRQGKFTTREEQEKQVERKQAKLAKEIEREEQEKREQQQPPSSAALTHAADDEPQAKRPRHDT